MKVKQTNKQANKKQAHVFWFLKSYHIFTTTVSISGHLNFYLVSFLGVFYHFTSHYSTDSIDGLSKMQCNVQNAVQLYDRQDWANKEKEEGSHKTKDLF